jgi:predicted AlkP superfamily phosphohydrolase/phosphomutase
MHSAIYTYYVHLSRFLSVQPTIQCAIYLTLTDTSSLHYYNGSDDIYDNLVQEDYFGGDKYISHTTEYLGFISSDEIIKSSLEKV